MNHLQTEEQELEQEPVECDCVFGHMDSYMKGSVCR